MTAIKIANLLRAIADVLADEQPDGGGSEEVEPETMRTVNEPAPAEKSKRQYKKCEKVDVFELESACCGDKVIQKGEGYECMKCGDICETQPKGEWQPPEPKKRGGRWPAKPCCGSRGPLHKRGCSGADGGAEFECDACSKRFKGMKGLVQTCPECGEKLRIFPVKH